MKRFYKDVSVGKEDGGFSILLDGRPIKTPNKSILIANNEKLAQLCAAEWDMQGEDIVPDTMPLTQLLNTKLDRVSVERAAMQNLVLNYIDTDLLCYRADNPEEIVKSQNDAWQPWLDWFENAYKLSFETTNGLTALKQDSAVHKAIQNSVEAFDDDRFTLFQMLVPSTGSIVLALAFMDGAAGINDLFNAAFAEENYKYALYNEDLHGGDPLTEKKKKSLRVDLEAAHAYLETLS